MNTITEHIGNSWLFTSPAPLAAALLILGADMALTLVHSIQELKGKLWRYFGAIAGVRVPDTLGRLVFFVVLTGALWLLAVIGIGGWLPDWDANTRLAGWTLGALIGARVADTWFSHISLARKGFTPNPGLPSTRYYLAEAAILTFLFSPALLAHKLGTLVGMGGATLFFLGVIPLLRLLRALSIFSAAEQWHAGEAPPRPAPIWTA